MSSVDDRIVNMQFNNKQFTQGAADSQKSLQSLESTLTKTAQGQGLTQMGSAVDGIKGKFSALEIAGVSALATIASKATSAGLELIKSLTIDPVLQGFQEYQTNLNSVQTVVANTGESVGKVNEYMQKLNTYSDQTIYNFSEMAHNIGTFTAAGVDLKTATSAIQGIANLAALSGSNSQQASMAMYQLSQAIAAGRVGLQDWNSVVNAGMGGKQFQTALAQNAIAMGQLSASAVDFGGKMGKLSINAQSFRQSISTAGGAASWLTSDVLTKTLSLLDGRLAASSYEAAGFSHEMALQKVAVQEAKLAAEGYSEATIKAMVKTANAAYESATVVKSLPQLMQVLKESVGSIWSNTFSIVMGNFNQSKKLWTTVSKEITGPQGIISKIGNSWTGMLRDWATSVAQGGSGGRSQVIKGLSRMARSITGIFSTLKDAFVEIFPPDGLSFISKLSKGFNQFTKLLMVHRATLEDLHSIFGGIFAVLHVGFTIVKGVAEMFYQFFKAISSGVGDTQGGLLSLLASVGDMLIAFDKWVTSGGKLVDMMANIGKIAGTFVKPFVDGIGLAVQAIGALVSGQGIDGVVKQFDSLGVSFSSVVSVMETGWNTISKLFGGSGGDGLAGGASKAASEFDKLKTSVSGFVKALPNMSSADIFTKIGEGAGTAVSGLASVGGNIIAGISAGIVAAIPGIKTAIGAVVTGIIDTFKSLMGIHSPAESMIGPGSNVTQGVAEGIKNGIPFIFDAILKVGRAIGNAFDQLFGNMDALDITSFFNSIFSGVLILQLSSLAGTIKDTFGGLGQALENLQTGIKATTLTEIAIAVALLVASLVALSLIDTKKMGIALGAIGTMMGALTATMFALSKIEQGKDGINVLALGASMVLLATAVMILATAVTLLAHQDPKKVATGIGFMAASLGVLVGALFLFTKMKGSIEGMAASVLILAVAMNLLATAVLAFGSMDANTIEKGLGAMGIGLGMLVLAMQGLDKMKSSPEGLAASILVLALAMNVMAAAVGFLGSMDIATLAKGMGFMAIGLGLMVGAIFLLSKGAPEGMAAAASILVIAVAMRVLANTIVELGSVPWEVAARGIGFLAAALAIILAAGAVAGIPIVAEGLIALGASVALLGAGAFLAGAGVMLFATGITLLVAAGTAGIAIMVVAIEAFLALLPSIAVQVAAAFVSFLDTIATAAPRIRQDFDKIFQSIIGVITDNIPIIGQMFSTLIHTGLQVIGSYISDYVEMGMTIIDNFIGGLAEHIPHIAHEVGKMITDFLNELDNHLPEIIKAGTDLIVHFIQGVSDSAVTIVNAAGDAILHFLHGLDSAVEVYAPQIRDVGLSIAGHLLDALSFGLSSRVGSIIDAAIPDSVNIPFVGRIGGDGRRSGRGPTPAQSVAAAQASVAGLVGAPGTAAYNASIQAQKKQAAADAAAYAAAYANQAAQKAQKASEDNPKNKKLKAAAKEAEKRAAKVQAAADKAQRIADGAIDEAQFQADMAKAIASQDFQEQGDLLSDQAAEKSAQAQKLLSRAAAERKAAEKLKGKDRKDMLKKAADDEAAAQALAQKAQDLNRQAKQDYHDSVEARIKEIQDAAAADEAARKAQAEYDAADAEGKKKILEKRAADDEAAAAAAKAHAQDLINQARAAANPDEAMRLLDEAEKASKDAQDLIDKAAQERQQAEQATQGGPGPTAGGIAPSRSVLEDAARAVDRYTASLAQAAALAGAEQGPVQYVQNNYSPEALPASQIYRNTKNLLSAQELKMGVKTS